MTIEETNTNTNITVKAKYVGDNLFIVGTNVNLRTGDIVEINTRDYELSFTKNENGKSCIPARVVQGDSVYILPVKNIDIRLLNSSKNTPCLQAGDILKKGDWLWYNNGEGELVKFIAMGDIFEGEEQEAAVMKANSGTEWVPFSRLSKYNPWKGRYTILVRGSEIFSHFLGEN